jgi:hypothetical protein
MQCDTALQLHQPDQQVVERFLGTCPDCLAWHLIDTATGLMALLPDETDLRNAWPATAPPRRSAASEG